MPMLVASRVMNLGLASQKPASLHWSGDTVTGTNLLGFVFQAGLRTDAQGRPAGLTEVYEHYPVRPGVTQAVEVAVSYQYDRPIKDWPLPTEIRVGTNWLAEILSVELSPRPLDESFFDDRPYINQRSAVGMLAVSRNEKEIHHANYNDLRDGLRRVGPWWLSKQELRSCVYLLFCAVTGGILSVGVARERKKNNNQKEKT
jgi:hypothetical protein